MVNYLVSLGHPVQLLIGIYVLQKYYLPLKEKELVERNLINDIFYKIPEIHVHHELLLSALKAKSEIWDTRQTIGDLLLNTVSWNSVEIISDLVDH